MFFNPTLIARQRQAEEERRNEAHKARERARAIAAVIEFNKR